MAIKIRDKIIENSTQFLQPGETVQAVIPGQTISGWWGALTYLWIFWNKFRVALVTDRRIIVLYTGRLTLGTPKAALYQLPRETTIGPANGLWWKCTTLGDNLYVHKRFHKDVVAADSILAG